MPAGFQAFDAAGNVTFDTNDNTGKIYGILSFTGTSGSFSEGRFTQYGGHVGFVHVLSHNGGHGCPIEWKVEGNTASYYLTDPTFPAISQTVLFGSVGVQ
jgi:hypothetical protein